MSLRQLLVLGSPGRPCLWSAGPGCVLRPVPQPLSSDRTRSLPDPGRRRTPEQGRTRGRFRRAHQRVRKSVPVRRRKARTSPPELLAQPEPNPTELKAKADAPGTEGIADADSTPVQRLPDAPSLHVPEERVVSAQVPALVRSIHSWLTSNVSAGHVLDKTLLALTEAHPVDVAITLLRCAPSCDRAAATMWRTIASSGRTLQKVLPTLLDVMEDWPWYYTGTSDGDNTDVFALAATLALWMIVQEPQCLGPLMDYSPHLLVDLLFQVFVSTEQTSEEVDTFWRGCQEQHDLPTDPNRFAVLTMKALLCCLHCEDVVKSVEDNRGWARLLNAHSRRYTALLAREKRRISRPLCSRITLHLLELLSREELCWDLPAMAFLVEDDSSVREASMALFTRVIKLIEREGKRPLKPLVCLSLLPLYFHRHDEKVVVKRASRKALLDVTRFLKRRDLGRLVNTEEPWSFGKCLLKKDRSRVAKYMHQALPYLRSPQQPLREAAIKFMGIAGGYLRGQPKELQLIIDALQAIPDDRSPAVSNLALQIINFVTNLQTAPYPRFQQFRDRLCRAWNTRPSLWG
ncbi:uncharacterized protein LOC135412454 [Pseudopipra pipra]|uniref:uncharacterized protein LOC135412454 n=1 Tax=Pseudopipra pipra TaxID=415032 RepID=UPI00313934E5